MAEWINANGTAIITVLTIVAMVVEMLRRSGKIQKERGDELTKKIEGFKDVMEDLMEKSKDKKLTPLEIAQVASSALKGSIANGDARPIVKAAISDGAAKADPKPEKKARPVLRAISGLILGRLGIPR